MAHQRTRNPRSAVERLRLRGGHDFDEDNETHIEAFLTLRRRSQVAGGSGSVTGHQLAAYIRSLDRPVWRPVEPPSILKFWAVPRANFPDGLPARCLAFVTPAELSARSALSRDHYYFIDHIIDRTILGMGVITCSCTVTAAGDVPATGDGAATRDDRGASGSIVTATGDGPVTGDGGGASAATGDAAATGGGHRLWRTGGHRSAATGGLRFLEHAAVQMHQAQVSFWAVPQANFPEGLPPLCLAAVVPAEHTAGCPFSWADYFFIGHIIERICLGANVIYCTNVG